MTFLPDASLAHLRHVADLPDLSETRYQVLEQIGRGGMGTVYRVRDAALERDVALKVLTLAESGDESARRLRRESRILAALEHPGIVPVHDVGTLPDGRVFYTMKLVRGERLDQLAPTAGLPDRLRIFERICETVAFAHAHGVIHRDLKPANVMVGPFGEVLVLDWGVARVLREPAAADPGPADTHRVDAETTAPGTVMGTPGYMAPEQALGDINAIDQRTDVYGLGAILHYLLLGARPDQSPAGRPAEISRPLWAIMRRALEADPGDRYPGASELAVDIARFRDGEPVSALPEGPLARTGRFISRYRTPILLVLAYLVMRVVVLVVAGR